MIYGRLIREAFCKLPEFDGRIRDLLASEANRPSGDGLYARLTLGQSFGELDAELNSLLERVSDVGTLNRHFALGLALQGNRRRIEEDFAGSFDLYQRSLRYLLAGPSPPSEVARFCTLFASVLLDVGDTAQCRPVLEYGLALCDEVDPRFRLLWQKADLERLAGAQGKAAEYYQETLLIAPSRFDGPVRLALALSFAEAKKPAEAAAQLARVGGFNGLEDQARLAWVRGLISAEAGRDDASALVEAAHKAFGLLGDVQATALTALDLASLWRQEGRASEVPSLAKQAYELLLSLGIPQQALAAFLLLQHATTEAVSIDLIRSDIPKKIAITRRRTPS